ncbi:MAG: pyridoxal phosphate-dependent aminotransferase [Polyangia bacterium]
MNPRLVSIQPSMIREINGKKRASSIDLGLGEPTLLPAMEPLQHALDWVRVHGSPYSPNPGLPELREAVARYHAYPSLDDASQVGITVGSQEALSVAILSLCDPASDEVLVIEPAYPLYAKLCELFAVRVRSVALDPADGFAPSAAKVLAALTPSTRVIVLASPSNPSGRVWPEGELRALAEGLGARGGEPTYIVSDEVYRELYFTAAPPPSPAAFWPHTVVVGSISKSCALTGLRIGWFIAPKAIAPQLHKAHQFLVSSTNTFGQRAAIELFARPELMTSQRLEYVPRLDMMESTLYERAVAHVPIEGAFYCFARLEGPLAHDSLRFCLALLDQHDVVTIPGIAFGAEGWARLSFVGDREQIGEGARRFAAFCGKSAIVRTSGAPAR